MADVFRRFGPAWRAANEGHLSLAQRRVMSAVELCRTAALGGHVERCADCAHTRVAYNSCRNRHCPKCQWRAAQAWLEAREAELLPVPYFHVVFTLPAGARRDRLPEQGPGLRPPAQGRGGGADHDRRRPEAPRGPDRRHRGAAHLGADARPPPARALHRAGRRHLPRRQPLGRLPAGLLPAGAGALAPVPAAVPRRPRRGARQGRAGGLRRPRRARGSPAPSGPTWRRSGGGSGWSTPRRRSPGRSRCWATSPATPTGSRSRTAGWWRSTTTVR